MSLDISFYAIRRIELADFSGLDFILSCLNVKDSDNCKDVVVGKEQLSNFVKRLRRELKKHTLPCNDEPVDDCLRCYKVPGAPIGNPGEYNEYYWDRLHNLYVWADGILNSFDWEHCKLVVNAWW